MRRDAAVIFAMLMAPLRLYAAAAYDAACHA